METQSLSSEEKSADLVITNAKVITVDKDFSIREAVAVKDGRIATVGTDHDVQPFIGPDECITVEEAVTMYTINGAWQDHMDTIKGSIEVGKLADLQVLGADILEVDPHVIGQIPVVMTIVGGKIVYSSANI